MSGERALAGLASAATKFVMKVKTAQNLLSMLFSGRSAILNHEFFPGVEISVTNGTTETRRVVDGLANADDEVFAVETVAASVAFQTIFPI